MYLISISIHTYVSLAERVKQILAERLLPILERAECAREPLLLEILTQVDPQTASFAVQFRTDDLAAAEQLLNGDCARFLDKLTRLYPDKILPFTTQMQIVDGKANL